MVKFSAKSVSKNFLLKKWLPRGPMGFRNRNFYPNIIYRFWRKIYSLWNWFETSHLIIRANSSLYNRTCHVANKNVTSLTRNKSFFWKHVGMFKKISYWRFCSLRRGLQNALVTFVKILFRFGILFIRKAKSENWCLFLRHVANVTFRQ